LPDERPASVPAVPGSFEKAEDDSSSLNDLSRSALSDEADVVEGVVAGGVAGCADPGVAPGVRGCVVVGLGGDG